MFGLSDYKYSPPLVIPSLFTPTKCDLVRWYGPWNITFRYQHFQEEYQYIKTYLKSILLKPVKIINLGDLCIVWTHNLKVKCQNLRTVRFSPDVKMRSPRNAICLYHFYRHEEPKSCLCFPTSTEKGSIAFGWSTRPKSSFALQMSFACTLCYVTNFVSPQQHSPHMSMEFTQTATSMALHGPKKSFQWMAHSLLTFFKEFGPTAQKKLKEVIFRKVTSPVFSTNMSTVV